ncbi:MAG: hypothetical protein AAGA85_22110 [Bacteroidota bacterium]
MIFYIFTASEIAHGVLIEQLQQMQIPYSARVMTDSSFPSFSIRNYGEVLVAEKEGESLKELFGQLDTQDYTVRLEKGKGSSKQWFTRLLAVYAVVISLVCLRYWYMVETGNDSKNFDIQWEDNNTLLLYYSKEDGSLLSSHQDANYDLNFEQSNVYARGGEQVSRSMDDNEDGMFEYSAYYSQDRQLVGELWDLDRNQIADMYWTLLASGDTLRFNDTNQDGIWELQR